MLLKNITQWATCTCFHTTPLQSSATLNPTTISVKTYTSSNTIIFLSDPKPTRVLIPTASPPTISPSPHHLHLQLRTSHLTLHPLLPPRPRPSFTPIKPKSKTKHPLPASARVVLLHQSYTANLTAKCSKQHTFEGGEGLNLRG